MDSPIDRTYRRERRPGIPLWEGMAQQIGRRCRPGGDIESRVRWVGVDTVRRRRGWVSAAAALLPSALLERRLRSAVGPLR